MTQQSGRVVVGRGGRAARVDALGREVLEDLPDHPGLRDERDDAHRSAAARAHQGIDLVDPANQQRPSAARCSPLEAGRLVRDRRRSRRSATAGGRGRSPRAPSPHHARVAEEPGLETGESSLTVRNLRAGAGHKNEASVPLPAGSLEISPRR
jgi:hypothetical protein